MSTTEIAIYAIYAFAVVMPLLPGLLELRVAHDDDPLKIDAAYARDPRFLGKSMREKLKPIMNEVSGEGRVAFLNRKNEFARVVHAVDESDHAQMDDVVLSRGRFVVGDHSACLDVYARGDVEVGASSRVRTLAGDSNATLGRGLQVVRWIDVSGECTIGDESDLGQSVSATRRLVVGRNVRFNRLFGRPIAVCSGQRAEIRALGIGPMFTSSMANDRLMVKSLVIDADETYDVDIIASGDVEVGPGACVTGSIKAAGRVTVGEAATVIGNVIARGDVEIKEDGTVFGHIFGDRDVTLAMGALVGENYAPKTLHASHKVNIAEGACVFGWLIAERGGESCA